MRYDAHMEQLISRNMRSAVRIVRAEAAKWHLPADVHEDILQDTLIRVVQYWKPGKAKDLDAYFVGSIKLNARTVALRLHGYHNGNKRPQSVKARGEDYTSPVGLYQTPSEGEDVIIDERILPSMPSAEDVYMATVPSKRQTALRGAIDSLPERQRTALTHQFYEELSVAESAALLGATTTEVYALRQNALKALKRKLNA